MALPAVSMTTTRFTHAIVQMSVDSAMALDANLKHTSPQFDSAQSKAVHCTHFTMEALHANTFTVTR